MDSRNPTPNPRSRQTDTLTTVGSTAVHDNSVSPGLLGVEPEGTLLRSDWFALKLLNQFRIFLLLAFAATFYLTDGFQVLGSRDATLFQLTHFLWMVVAAVFITTINLKKPALEVQFYLQQYIDILAITGLMYASGGISSNLGVLLLVNIAITANFARARYTILFAAIATTMVLVAELLAGWLIGDHATHLIDTAMLGVALFAVALVTTSVIHRYSASQAAPSVQRLSTDQLKELREQIVEEIDSGVLHLDSSDHVQLVNTEAALQLGLDAETLPAHLSYLCPPLWHSLQEWRKHPAQGVIAFSDPGITQDVLPHFVLLSDNSLLIRLEDQVEINRKLQQLKQAALGRMSSSIAHEIRNPLGAISNAVQLLGESETLETEDRDLVDIAYKQTQRINRIIEDVMQLSARSNLNTEDIQLHDFILDLAERFTEQNDLAPGTILLKMHNYPTTRFDAHHLDQIVWNLCSNSILHNTSAQREICINVYSETGSQPIIDISDNGPGINPGDMDKIFEPFFTTRSGTGLGLCICRELCTLNGATLNYIPVSHGSCFRILLPDQANNINPPAADDNWDWKKAA